MYMYSIYKRFPYENTFVVNIFSTIFQDSFKLAIGYLNVLYLAQLILSVFPESVGFFQLFDFVGHNTLDIYGLNNVSFLLA